MATVATFNFDTLRDALEHTDEATLIDLYADNAELKVVDQTRPPSSPLLLTGKPAIAELFHDICSRAMTHEVQDPVINPDRIAFNEACRYPDGVRVLSSNFLDIEGGKIVRHRLVQAWDQA
jgi:hypothetical protein